MPHQLELWMCFLLNVAVVTYCARIALPPLLCLLQTLSTIFKLGPVQSSMSVDKHPASKMEKKGGGEKKPLSTQKQTKNHTTYRTLALFDL